MRNLRLGMLAPKPVRKEQYKEASCEEIKEALSYSNTIKNFELEFIKESVEAYRLIKKIFKLKPDCVLYPSCGLDANVQEAFGKDKVIHIDLDNRYIELFKKIGCMAYCMDIRDFHTHQPIDVLVLTNPASGGKIDTILRVKIGGYIICNNYHNTADTIFVKRAYQFEYKGLVVCRRGKKPRYIKYKNNPKKFLQNAPEKINCLGQFQTILIGINDYHIFKRIK